MIPEVYLCPPTVELPSTQVDNAELMRRIKANFHGDPAVWPLIEAGVQHVVTKCNSQMRYIEEDTSITNGQMAAKAAKRCLDAYGLKPTDLDMVVYGGIARDYYEPSTAMEVAGRLGVEKVHAYDVTSACAGQMEGMHTVIAQFMLHPEYNTALICGAELTRQHLSYDIQSPEELLVKAAGLTIGNAASAMLLRRTPFPGGSARLLAMDNHSLPQNWHLCSAPIHGTFTSHSRELFQLNVFVPPVLTAFLARLGWTPLDVDHYICHQPSEHMVEKVMKTLGVPLERAILTHHLYANTASTTVPVTYYELAKRGVLKEGDKLLMATAAAGFSIVSALGVWHA